MLARRASLALLLPLLLAPTSQALGQSPPPQSLGIVFDPVSLTSTTTVPGFATFNVYVVANDVGEISAWEAGLSKDPAFSILSVTFSEASALNIGNSVNYIVGLGGCFNYGTGIKTMATINGGYFAAPTAPEMLFCLTPPSPASMPGAMSYVDCADNILPFTPMCSGGVDYPDNCAVANPTGESPSCLVAPGPVCNITAPDLDFGNVLLGSFATRDLTVTAGSSEDTLVVDVASPCPEFRFERGERQLTLLPGESETLTLVFTPGTTGPASCSIQLSPDCDPLEFTGTGQGIPACEIRPDSLAFAPHVVGTSSRQSVWVVNTGSATLDGYGLLVGNSEHYSLTAVAGNFSVAPGDSAQLEVEFHPGTTGDLDSALQIGLWCELVPIRGAGAPPPTFVASTSSPLPGGARSVLWTDFDRNRSPELGFAYFQGDVPFRSPDGQGALDDPLPQPFTGLGDVRSALAWDSNGDRRQDFLVIQQGDPNRYFVQYAPGKWVEPPTSGLEAGGDALFAAPADVDGDGQLELYMGRAGGAQDQLLFVAAGGWTDGLPPAMALPRTTQAAAWGDPDGDGDADLYVAYRNVPNALFLNDGSGGFSEFTPPVLADAGNGNGVAWGDFDADSDLDLFLANFGEPNRLFRNDGGLAFTELPAAAWADSGRSVSPSFVDVDQDGRLDLYYCDAPGIPRVVLNREQGWAFASVGELAVPGNFTASAWGDADGDGDLDLALAAYDDSSSSRLLLNDSSGDNHWLQVGLTGTSSNTHGLGTWLRAYTASGVQHRYLSGSTGNRAQDALVVHFGLGSDALVDSLVLEWPSGIVQRILDLPADQRIDVLEDANSTAIGGGGQPRLALTMLGNVPNPFNPATTLHFHLPSAGAARVHVLDTSGRLVRELFAGPLDAGPHEIRWDGRDATGGRVASGTYYGVVTHQGHRAARSMTLLK